MADKQKVATMKMNKKGLGARHWIVGIVLTGLIAYLMISFSIQFMQQNGNPSLQQDNNLISASSKLDSSLNDFSTAGQQYYGALKTNNKPDPLQIFLILPGIINTVMGMVSLPYNTILALMTLMAGEVPSPAFTVLAGVITGIIFITMVFLIYKVIRTGESER